MRRYLITFDFQNASYASNQVESAIRAIDADCEQPHRGAWIVTTALTAGELRQRLLPFVNFSDRLFICEAGQDAAKFNALQKTGGRNVIRFEGRKRSAILDNVLARKHRASVMLKAATAGS